MYITTQFLLLTTMVLVLLTAGAALTHQRMMRLYLALIVKVSARIGDWAYGIHADVWEAVHTSDFKPGRLGTLWLRVVNMIEARSSALAIQANRELMAMTEDDGTFVEAD